MKIEGSTVEEYLSNLPEDKKEAVERLRQTVLDHLPEGYEETISYGMLGYVVPLSKYPRGYHVNPELPLPFINVAAQKHFVALYHMGIYANKDILDWFTEEYKKRANHKLDMGKSCIRFKKPQDIPFDLVAELCQKISPDQWIQTYEENIKR